MNCGGGMATMEEGDTVGLGMCHCSIVIPQHSVAQGMGASHSKMEALRLDAVSV